MSTKNSFIACTLCLLTIFTLSCSSLNKSEPENPIIPDNTRGLTTYAINPSRRLVIVKPLPPDINDPEVKKMALAGNDKFLPKLICGEPPPDVSDNIASALSAALSAKVEFAEKGLAGLAGNYATILNTTAVLLFKRTQGLQLYRDGMYHLCLAVMNGFVTEDQYLETANYLLNESIVLIKEEIPFIKAIEAEVSAQNAAVYATEAKKAAVEAETLSKNSKQSAEAAAKKAAGNK
jgi:hypothetical protein